MCLFLPTGLHAEKRTDEQRDYGGNRLASLTEKMPNLLKLRRQLKLLVVGILAVNVELKASFSIPMVGIKNSPSRLMHPLRTWALMSSSSL